jgi:hypothetical protein
MRRLVCAIAGVLCAIGLSACALSSSPAQSLSTSHTTPAVGSAAPSVATEGATAAQNAAQLASLDGNRNPPSAYQADIEALEAPCKLSATDIASLADAGYRQLVGNKITNQTRLGVLDALRQALPASTGISQCDQILAAYLVEEETPNSPTAAP